VGGGLLAQVSHKVKGGHKEIAGKKKNQNFKVKKHLVVSYSQNLLFSKTL
jgi:hypothetical protein